jgi:hypothetical protein
MLRVVPRQEKRVRAGLALDLVHALFCGLSRRERRMAVFVCAADETSDQNPRKNYFFGGFAAPVNDWDGAFAAAWNERVLEGRPQIPYMHQTSIRSPKWRATKGNGITEHEAMRRVDEAACVIQSMGSLIPVMVSLPEDVFQVTVRRRYRQAGVHSAPRDLPPDVLAYISFAYIQLRWLHEEYPDVERVDFMVEQNGAITRHVAHFHDSLQRVLPALDHPELAELVGTCTPVEKDRIPTQAADMFGWHCRNARRDTLDRAGWRRYHEMTGGDPRRPSLGRFGHSHDLGETYLRELAARFDELEADESTGRLVTDGSGNVIRLASKRGLGC